MHLLAFFYSQRLVRPLGVYVLITAAGPVALAQSALDAGAASGLRWQWGTSAGFSDYYEPTPVMGLKGPELGIHLRLDRPGHWPRLQLQADLLSGLQRYSSSDGELRDRQTLDSRWRLLYQIAGEGAESGLHAGLAMQTSYSDLRGMVNATTAGYERLNLSTWLALQWRQPIRTEDTPQWRSIQVDLGHMLHGRQHSYLSQVGTAWRDVANRQPWGWYAQVQTSWVVQRGLALEPFIRYTQVGNSDIADAGLQDVYEPANRRWQIGLKATWPAR